MKPLTRHLCIAGALLWGALAVLPVRHALESTMTLQMLVQIPLLALAGGWFAQGTPEGLDRRLAGWNQSGISGLLLASLAGMVWMLPLAIGFVIVLILVWKLMWGHIDTGHADRRATHQA